MCSSTSLRTPVANQGRDHELVLFTHLFAHCPPPFVSIRYVDFLVTLCRANGKAVRPNQWKVCELLVKRKPHLLVQLELKTANGKQVAATCLNRRIAEYESCDS